MKYFKIEIKVVFIKIKRAFFTNKTNKTLKRRILDWIYIDFIQRALHDIFF
jgi:hypothetical protein